jgi:hypothetical protein
MCGPRTFWNEEIVDRFVDVGFICFVMSVYSRYIELFG